MRTRDHVLSLVAILFVLFAGATLAAPTAAQERAPRDYDRILDQLQAGIAALDELGREEERDQLIRVVDEVRRERDLVLARREAQERASDEIAEVRRRLKVMRYAVEVLVEVDRHDSAELVEYAMHARELAIEGRRDAEAQRIREAAPDRGQLAELLKYAADLQGERGRAEKAKALADLSNVYLEQWKRRQRAEREVSTDFTDRATRLQILRWARDAHAEKGDERLTKVLRAAVEIGELQLADAGMEAQYAAVEAAGADFSMGMIIESLQLGSRLYAEWARPGRAKALNGLAEYYAKRQREQRQERDGTAPAGDEQQPSPDASTEEIRRLVAQLERLEAQLAEMRAQLEAIDRRRRR